MKKKLLLMACLFLGLGLTGCGKTNNYEEFKDAILKLNDYNSVEATLKVDASVESDGLSVDVNLPALIKVAEENGNAKMYLKIDKNTLIEEETELYISYNDKLANIYYSYLVNDEKTWIKQEQSLEEYLKDIDLTNSTEEFKNYVDKYITEDRVVYVGKEDNLKHYQFVIDDSLLEQIAKESETEFEKTGIEFKIDIYLDKDGNIAKVEVDFISVLNKILESTEEEDTLIDASMFKTLTVSIEFANYNNVTVEIPEDIVTNSKTLDEIEDDYDFDYDYDFDDDYDFDYDFDYE